MTGAERMPRLCKERLRWTSAMGDGRSQLALLSFALFAHALPRSAPLPFKAWPAFRQLRSGAL